MTEVLNSSTKDMVEQISTNRNLLKVDIPGYSEFGSIHRPDSMRLTEMGFSSNNAKVLDFEYRDVNGEQRVTSVVAKSFEKNNGEGSDEPDLLENELAAYKRIEEAGSSFPHLKPAFCISTDSVDYFATEAAPNLMPFSAMLKMDFRESRNGEELLSNYQKHLAGEIVALLRIHMIGIRQIDTSPKNVGVDTETGDEMAFDFEICQLTESVHQPLSLKESSEEVLKMIISSNRYAVDGYFPREVPMGDGSERRALGKDRRLYLESLGLTGDEFHKIGTALFAKAKDLYEDIVSGGVAWTREIDQKLKSDLAEEVVVPQTGLGDSSQAAA